MVVLCLYAKQVNIPKYQGQTPRPFSCGPKQFRVLLGQLILNSAGASVSGSGEGKPVI